MNTCTKCCRFEHQRGGRDRGPALLRGTTLPGRYAVLAPPLLLVPHAAVALLMAARDRPLVANVGFWLLPLRRLAMSPDLPPGDAAVAFVVALAAAAALALMSSRRANSSGMGHVLAAAMVIPAVQCRWGKWRRFN